MRDHHYGRMCFKSVKTLGALHSYLWKRPRPSASAFSAAKNVKLLGHYSIILKTTYVAIHGTHFMAWHQLSWAGALVQWLNSLLGKSEIVDSNPTVAFKFQRNKNFLPRSLVKFSYCGEPLWPKGSVLGLRPTGLEFQILCLEGSVIIYRTILRRFSSPSLAYMCTKVAYKPHSFFLIYYSQLHLMMFSC